MVLRKSSDFWLALIFVGPDTVEFLFVDSAVICRLKLALNLSQQSSHIPPPQTVPLSLILRKVGGNWLYVRTEGPDVETQCGAIWILPAAPVRSAVGRLHVCTGVSSPQVKQSRRVPRASKQPVSGMSMNFWRGSLAITLVRRVLRFAAFCRFGIVL
jgi:hypothetical protein